jgi:hypothetical protein
LWQAIPKRYDASYDGLSFRFLVWTEYYEGCLRNRYPKRAINMTTPAMYKTWPEAQRLPYVESVIAGIEIALHETPDTVSGDDAPVLSACKPDPVAAGAALGKMDGSASDSPSAAELIFAAYWAACREPKGK